MRRADYEQAVEAARRWIAEHGRYPQQQEWEHRAPGRPSTRTIKRRWAWESISGNRETREQWLGRAVEMMRPDFADAGAPLPEQLAVSTTGSPTCPPGLSGR